MDPAVNRSYLRKNIVIDDMERMKPFNWNSLDYGLVGLSIVGGGLSYAVGRGIFIAAAHLCIGGCALYNGDRSIIVGFALGLVGAITSFAIPLIIDCKNKEKKDEAYKVLGKSEFVSSSQYKKLIEIQGSYISHNLDSKYQVLSDKATMDLEDELLISHENLLREIMAANSLENFYPTADHLLTKDNIQEFLTSKIDNSNVRKIFKFAETNRLEHLQRDCERYFKKHQARIKLSGF